MLNLLIIVPIIPFIFNYKLKFPFSLLVKLHIFFIFSIIEMWITFIILLLYNSNNNEFQFRQSFHINGYYIEYAVDGISLPLILITTLIIPIILIIREKYNNEDIKFQKIVLAVEIFLIYIFIVMDIALFYTMFELILIPILIIIIGYGSRFKKFEAGYRFILFTIIGSLLFLLSIILIFTKYGSSSNELIYLFTSIEANLSTKPPIILILFWFSFLTSFAVKIPIYPFHSWLPEAHTEAPTTGSVLLAAILLKLGIYGFLRYSIYLLSDVNTYLSPIILSLSILAIINCSFITLRLIDFKKIIAYSSIIHMNLVMVGFYANEFFSIVGSYYTIISHAFISSGLFILIGILYRRYFTRNILYIRGLSSLMPLYSIFFFFFLISNISIPLTSGFPGELLIFIGILNNALFYSIIILLTILLTTGYNFNLINKLIFGLISTALLKFRDISYLEFWTLFPLLFWNVLLGNYTTPLIDIIYLSITKIYI